MKNLLKTMNLMHVIVFDQIETRKENRKPREEFDGMKLKPTIQNVEWNISQKFNPSNCIVQSLPKMKKLIVDTDTVLPQEFWTKAKGILPPTVEMLRLQIHNLYNTTESTKPSGGTIVMSEMFPNLVDFAWEHIDVSIPYQKQILKTLPLCCEVLAIHTIGKTNDDEIEKNLFVSTVEKKELIFGHLKRLKKLTITGHEISVSVFERFPLESLKALRLSFSKFDNNTNLLKILCSERTKRMETLELVNVYDLKPCDFAEISLSSSLKRCELEFKDPDRSPGEYFSQKEIEEREMRNLDLFPIGLTNLILCGDSFIILNASIIPQTVELLCLTSCQVMNYEKLGRQNLTSLRCFKSQGTSYHSKNLIDWKSSKLTLPHLEGFTQIFANLYSLELADCFQNPSIHAFNMMVQVPSSLKELTLQHSLHQKHLRRLPCINSLRNLTLTQGWSDEHLKELTEDPDFSFLPKLEYFEISQLKGVSFLGVKREELEKRILKKMKNPSCIVFVKFADASSS